MVTIVSKSFDDDQDITFTIGADALGLGVGNPIDVPFGMVSREPQFGYFTQSSISYLLFRVYFNLLFVAGIYVLYTRRQRDGIF